MRLLLLSLSLLVISSTFSFQIKANEDQKKLLKECIERADKVRAKAIEELNSGELKLCLDEADIVFENNKKNCLKYENESQDYADCMNDARKAHHFQKRECYQFCDYSSKLRDIDANYFQAINKCNTTFSQF